MTRLLREPLLHFLALGALLFVLYARVAPRAAQPTDEIVVTRGVIENLAGTFAGTRQRPPSAEELDGLVDGWIRDEVLYREGVALGLDRGDPVIKNRVRLKVELLGDEAATVAASEAELQAWLDAHTADYVVEARYTFDQVYFDPSRRAATLDADVGRARADLGDARAPEEAGDPTALPRTLRAASIRDVERTFGPDLAHGLGALPVGVWAGPVRSAYGVHLIRIAERTDARAPSLAEVRDAVERDWQRAHVVAAQDDYYRRLRARYSIVVERTDGAVDASSLASRH